MSDQDGLAVVGTVKGFRTAGENHLVVTVDFVGPGTYQTALDAFKDVGCSVAAVRISEQSAREHEQKQFIAGQESGHD